MTQIVGAPGGSESLELIDDQTHCPAMAVRVRIPLRLRTDDQT